MWLCPYSLITSSLSLFVSHSGIDEISVSAFYIQLGQVDW